MIKVKQIQASNLHIKIKASIPEKIFVSFDNNSTVTKFSNGDKIKLVSGGKYKVLKFQRYRSNHQNYT